MSNIIHTDNGGAIGFYNDLYKEIRNEITQSIEGRDVERAKELIDQLDEMGEHANYDGLLELSMNNGMGFTCRPYKHEGGR